MAIDLVAHNPHLKKPVAALMGALEGIVPCEHGEAEAAAAAAWQDSFGLECPAVFDTLVRAGAIEQRTFVDGEAYPGALEDIQFDESIPLDAAVEVRVDITEDGRELARSVDPMRMVEDLVADRPLYRPVFERMIACCCSAAGASREDLEQIVEQDGHPKSVSGERVYPQYFIDALESAGAIEWDGVWRATNAGRGLLAEA